jgi:hypothetical protein
MDAGLGRVLLSELRQDLMIEVVAERDGVCVDLGVSGPQARPEPAINQAR